MCGDAGNDLLPEEEEQIDFYAILNVPRDVSQDFVNPIHCSQISIECIACAGGKDDFLLLRKSSKFSGHLGRDQQGLSKAMSDFPPGQTLGR